MPEPVIPVSTVTAKDDQNYCGSSLSRWVTKVSERLLNSPGWSDRYAVSGQDPGPSTGYGDLVPALTARVSRRVIHLGCSQMLPISSRMVWAPR